ncbi:HAD-IA family hydrolase [Saccharomonospora saliphila]|uniref:HAD-IA family hydrolase n=1 Tax=Saccharomonospora saliphila TaxID=369829 RepID=UPI00036FDCF7|nr:HAD-IA family hydrolase [Saccharomonospora saliphila]
MSWVVFDYGEVISERTGALPAMAERLGVPRARFEPAYWAHRDAYDRGASDTRYWEAVADTVGVTVDAAAVAELTERDIDGWSRHDLGCRALLDALADDGTALALLSNAPASFAAHTRRQPWLSRFHETLFSADLGVAKPDREIFDRLVERLGADPADCVFFDDRAANVDAARRVGLDAHLWRGADHARTLLRTRR